MAAAEAAATAAQSELNTVHGRHTVELERKQAMVCVSAAVKNALCS